MPKVTVVIPTFNRAQLVTHAIDSVLAQTFQDFELIVVDDRSTDNTAEILRSKYGERITLVSSEVKFLPIARNTGIKLAKGEYIALLDDDDYWYPTKLEKQVALLESSSPAIGLIYCSNDVIVDGKVSNEKYIASQRGNVFKTLLLENVITGSASAALVRKECFDKVGYFDPILQGAEDRDMWIRIARDYEVDFVPEVLVSIRHIGSSVKASPQRFKTMFKPFDKVFNDPYLPKDIRALKRKSYAIRHLDCVGLYAKANQRANMLKSFLMALWLCPLCVKKRHWKVIGKRLIKYEKQ